MYTEKRKEMIAIWYSSTFQAKERKCEEEQNLAVVICLKRLKFMQNLQNLQSNSQYKR